jgi:hypothetical protein
VSTVTAVPYTAAGRSNASDVGLDVRVPSRECVEYLESGFVHVLSEGVLIIVLEGSSTRTAFEQGQRATGHGLLAALHIGCAALEPPTGIL